MQEQTKDSEPATKMGTCQDIVVTHEDSARNDAPFATAEEMAAFEKALDEESEYWRRDEEEQREVFHDYEPSLDFDPDGAQLTNVSKHEAGHAIVGHLSGLKITSVCVIPRFWNVKLGYEGQYHHEGMCIRNDNDVFNCISRMTAGLAGDCIEWRDPGDFTTSRRGVSLDLAHIADVWKDYVEESTTNNLPVPEFDAFIQRAYLHALALLRANRKVFDAIVALLTTKYSLNEEDLAPLLARLEKPTAEQQEQIEQTSQEMMRRWEEQRSQREQRKQEEQEEHEMLQAMNRRRDALLAYDAHSREGIGLTLDFWDEGWDKAPN
jgi:hypothetical protein